MIYIVRAFLFSFNSKKFHPLSPHRPLSAVYNLFFILKKFGKRKIRYYIW